MLELLIQRVCEHYKTDPSRASVTISFLSNGKYYISIIRYLEKFGGNKQVMYKVQSDTLDAGIKEIAQVFEEVLQREQQPVK